MTATILALLLSLTSQTSHRADCLTCRADFGRVSVGNRVAKSPTDIVNAGGTPSALDVTYTRGLSARDGRKVSPNMVAR